MPIYGQPAAEGEAPPILGVAQCLNKRDGKSFTAQDEQMMAALPLEPALGPEVAAICCRMQDVRECTK